MSSSRKCGWSEFESDAPSSSSQEQKPDAEEDEVDEDDLCAICHLLICRPVTTTCKHTLCRSCMVHWADVSISVAMTTVGINETWTPPSPSANQIEVRCPMCRTQTTARFDPEIEAKLIRKYPKTYWAREAEERAEKQDTAGAVIETLTLCIGNSHHLVRVENPESQLKHQWTFFVRPERTDLIEEVQIFLVSFEQILQVLIATAKLVREPRPYLTSRQHPTFRNPRVILQHPPYQIGRLGWGYFNIIAHVILKAGYSWDSTQAQNAPDGGEKGLLPLEWMLSFDGDGTQARLRLKIKKQKETIDEEIRAQEARARRAWAEQRRRDPDFVPPAEEG
jgi:YEATS family